MNHRAYPRRRPEPASVYDCREENGRWSVHDTRRGMPAEIRGVPQIGLDLVEAEELTAILNRLEAQRAFGQAAREE